MASHAMNEPNSPMPRWESNRTEGAPDERALGYAVRFFRDDFSGLRKKGSRLQALKSLMPERLEEPCWAGTTEGL